MLARSSTVNLVFEILTGECWITSPVEAGLLSASVVINILAKGGSTVATTPSAVDMSAKASCMVAIATVAVTTASSSCFVLGFVVMVLLCCGR